MSKFICLQVGHYPRTTGVTGAPGEQETNWRITNRLDDLLIDRGFVVQIVGADPTDVEITKDFDLFLSLHCDANSAIEGGCIGFPEPSTDGATIESQRLCKEIESVYFKETGIKNVPGKITNGIKYYYMWKRLSAKTPCVLLEMGESLDAHDQVILNDTEMVAVAIAKGICKAFDVNYEPVLPDPITPPQPIDPCQATKEELEMTKIALSTAIKDYSEKLALKDEELINRLKAYKQKLITDLNNYLDNHE